MRETVSGWVRGRRQWLVDCLGEKKHLPTIISLLSDTILRDIARTPTRNPTQFSVGYCECSLSAAQ